MASLARCCAIIQLAPLLHYGIVSHAQGSLQLSYLVSRSCIWPMRNSNGLIGIRDSRTTLHRSFLFPCFLIHQHALQRDSNRLNRQLGSIHTRRTLVTPASRTSNMFEPHRQRRRTAKRVSPPTRPCRAQPNSIHHIRYYRQTSRFVRTNIQ